MREPNTQDQLDLRPTEAGNGWSGMKAIAIAREYGSGGGEIARRLTARLGWQLLDHEIVAEVARSTDLSESEARRLDEHGMSFVTRLLTGLAYAMPEHPLSTLENPLQA